MSTALAIYEKVQDPIAFSNEMAETCAAITGCNISQGKGVALTCLCEGLTPVEFKRRYHWIPSIGPSMRADAMRAEFRMNHGGNFEIIENTAECGAIKFIDSNGHELLSSVTWEDAKGEPWPWKKECGPGTKKSEPIAQNLKDSWATPLSRINMLIARATSRGLRLICPELVAGIYTPEEMEDLDVVSSTVTTSQPVKRSAAEAMGMAAAATTNGESATAAPPFDPAEDVEDGEFTPATSSDTPADPQGEGFATKAQIERLSELRVELNPPQMVWDEALSKRGAKTTHQLTKVGAADLIEKLEAKRRRAEPVGKN